MAIQLTQQVVEVATVPDATPVALTQLVVEAATTNDACPVALSQVVVEIAYPRDFFEVNLHQTLEFSGSLATDYTQGVSWQPDATTGQFGGNSPVGATPFGVANFGVYLEAATAPMVAICSRGATFVCLLAAGLTSFAGGIGKVISWNRSAVCSAFDALLGNGRYHFVSFDASKQAHTSVFVLFTRLNLNSVSSAQTAVFARAVYKPLAQVIGTTATFSRFVGRKMQGSLGLAATVRKAIPKKFVAARAACSAVLSRTAQKRFVAGLQRFSAGMRRAVSRRFGLDFRPAVALKKFMPRVLEGAMAPLTTTEFKHLPIKNLLASGPEFAAGIGRSIVKTLTEALGFVFDLAHKTIIIVPKIGGVFHVLKETRLFDVLKEIRTFKVLPSGDSFAVQGKGEVFKVKKEERHFDAPRNDYKRS